MADCTDPEVEQNVNSTGNVEALDENYNILKALAKTAVIEFDDLKLKCREYFLKYKAEHERYLKAKADLDQLKNISSNALDEYEYLQRKFIVEQECRDKAVEIASKAVGQNKQLKRQSQLIMTHIAGLSGEGIDFAVLQALEDGSSESDSDSAIIQLQDEIKELKEKVENLKKELKTAKRECQIAKEGFNQEKQAHAITRKRLASSDKKLKQLNRVSVMAFEEFNVLQTKFELETQCRVEAEKLAVEARKADEVLKRKSLILNETASQDERLAKAFEEISTLSKQLEEARAEKEEKIKELTEELTLSKDGEYLKAMKDKLDVAQEEVENLENQVTEAQKQATEAGEKIKKLEKKLDDLKKASVPPPPPPPPAAPPPPPPPPPPTTVVKKFMNIMGKKKKGDLKRGQKKPDDPLANAMKEMMDRINSGKVQLKPVGQKQRNSASSEEEEAPAMNELGSLLKTLKKSPSIENLLEKSPTKTEETCEWSSLKLRKRSDQGMSRQASEHFSDNSNGLFKTSPLRKARSYSTNDILDESPEVKDEATSELRKILQRKKAQAERDMENKNVSNEVENKEIPKTTADKKLKEVSKEVDDIKETVSNEADSTA